jgi:hypothetical protein
MRFSSLFATALLLAAFLSACAPEARIAAPPEPPPVPPNYGSPCAGAGDCVGGLGCADIITDGLCTAVCTDAACPGEGLCEDLFGTRLCLGPCDTADDCGRDELQCFRGACRTRCGGDADCGAGAICDAGRCAEGTCTRDADCGARGVCTMGRCSTRPLGGEGAACADASDCDASLICLPPAAGGVCARTCVDSAACGDLFSRVCTPIAIDTDGNTTPDTVNSVCVDFASADGTLGSACTAATDCATRACVAGECTQVCDDAGDCLLGHECLPGQTLPGARGTFSGCGYTPATAVGTVDIPLGTPRLSAGGTTADFVFAVPSDAVSVSLVARQTSGTTPLPVTFVNVVSPTRTTLFSIDDISRWVDPPVRWLPTETEQAASMLIPNSTADRIAFRGGRHGVNVALFQRFEGDTAAETFEVLARVKRAPGARVTRGTLDLNIFCATSGLTAATAPTSTRLAQALDAFEAIYATRGITLGTVRYADVSGTSFRVIDTVDGPTSELARLFASSAGRTETAINVFFVDSINGTRDGFTTLGIAGGIPGPPATHGTLHSGVVVSFPSSAIGTAAKLGETLAHELGHYLGLFHNTESARPCAPGTGPTASVSCAPFGGGDVLADTTLGDRTNLMYWAATGGTALSVGQGYVMLRSAVVR